MSFEVALKLDVTGLACPMPIVKTRQAMNELAEGKVMEVVSTDKGSVADFRAWSETTGHQYVGLITEGDVFKHYLRKSATTKAVDMQFEPSVSVAELSSLLTDDAVLLDVREEAEYAFGHIAEAISLPLDEIHSCIRKLDETKTYYVICRSGSRSQLAAQQLVELGMKRVFNVKEGMNGWTGELQTLTV